MVQVWGPKVLEATQQSQERCGTASLGSPRVSAAVGSRAPQGRSASQVLLPSLNGGREGWGDRSAHPPLAQGALSCAQHAAVHPGPTPSVATVPHRRGVSHPARALLFGLPPPPPPPHAPHGPLFMARGRDPGRLCKRRAFCGAGRGTRDRGAPGQRPEPRALQPGHRRRAAAAGAGPSPSALRPEPRAAAVATAPSEPRVLRSRLHPPQPPAPRRLPAPCSSPPSQRRPA